MLLGASIPQTGETSCEWSPTVGSDHRKPKEMSEGASERENEESGAKTKGKVKMVLSEPAA